MTGDAFFGKFRGTVTDNRDPVVRGRIKALVPDVTRPGASDWALPCFPVGLFAVPAVGADVWIEFEQGDPNRPIWTGCWWSVAADVPPAFARDPQQVLLQTSGGHSVLLDDTPGAGGITLHTAGGQTIALADGGVIEIDNGSGAVVVLQGATVSVNNSALEVP
jgi:uncharacterized protein involved in type VI secretion and phage assembly